jgi:hypothetical protein
MKALDAPAVSVMLEEVQLGIEPVVGPDGVPTYPVAGRGVLAPGMVIPNAWWGRPRLVHFVEVSEPDRARADGALGIQFWGRCRAQDFAQLRALIDGGARELVACEVVPAIIEALGAAGELAAKLGRTPTVGTAVEWGPSPMAGAVKAHAQGQILKKYAQQLAEAFAPTLGIGATIAPPEPRPRHMVIHDLIRLAAGQEVPGGRDAVLREADDRGLMGSADFRVLVEAARAAGPAPPTSPGRPARVRVVDT